MSARRKGKGKTKGDSSTGFKLEVVFFELGLPLGVGLDDFNIVQELGQDGSAEVGGMQAGDRVTHVDGREVRNGIADVADALDRTQAVHTVLAQRLAALPDGVSYLTVRIKPKNGGLGVGLTDGNIISEIIGGSACADDGRLQARHQSTVYNWLPLCATS